ncbi:MAG: EamA family transporter [Nitrososphaerota archaeon]
MPELIRGDVALALVAFLCLGLTDFIRKKGALAGSSPIGYLLMETVVLLAIVPIASYLLESGLPKLDSSTFTYAPISGITIAIALLALMYGLKIGEGSLVIPISRLGLALATLLSLFILGESITWTRVAGIVMAIAAVFMLSR